MATLGTDHRLMPRANSQDRTIDGYQSIKNTEHESHLGNAITVKKTLKHLL